MSENDRLLGILPGGLDPLRYTYETLEPDEVTGLLVDRVPPGSRVLDVGCGTGSFLRLLSEHRQAQVTGIEPDPERAEAARKHGHTVVTGYYDEETAARLGTFDVILFADVLEHMDSPGPVLQLAARWLAPGGMVLASIPNVAHWTIRLALLSGRFDYTPYGLMDATHLRWFTAASVRRLFEAAGFRTIEIDWTSGAHLPGYERFPLVVMRTYGLRRRSVRRLVSLWPALFGFQHVVTARV